jgi:hypothetical protein
MRTNSGKQCFHLFLVSEYATENLEFYAAAENLLLLQHQTDAILPEFNALLDRFIRKTATSQINISALLVKKLLAVEAEETKGGGREEGEGSKIETIFDLVAAAQHEISNILEFGSFLRFQGSELYMQHMAGNTPTSRV